MLEDDASGAVIAKAVVVFVINVAAGQDTFVHQSPSLSSEADRQTAPGAQVTGLVKADGAITTDAVARA